VDLEENVAAYCQEQNLITPGDKIVVGVSGGPDSLCLLALLKQMSLDQNLHLHVAHLNHGLRGQAADEDAAFIAQLAQSWNLPATIEKEDVAAAAQKNKQGLEEAARQARYNFLVGVAQEIKASKIAVGHNANDQTETVLMRFLRGAGVTGLRGMLPATPLTNYLVPEKKTSGLAPPMLIRPLLNTPRAEIEAFCRAHNLEPRFDYSNQERTFLRNRLRHDLLPLLETYNPNIHQALQKTAGLMTADHEVLQKELDRAWRFVVKSESAQAISIDLHDWQILPLAMQRGILRLVVQTLRQSLYNIEFSHIDQAIALLKKGRTGARLDLPHNMKLTIEYDTFTLADQSYQPPLPNLPYLNKYDRLTIKIPGITLLPHNRWYLHTNLLVAGALSEAHLKRNLPWRVYLDAAVVGASPILRSRQPGDIFHPFGLNGRRQKLKDFMINQKIPADRRNHIPLLVSEKGQICWICGWRIDHRCRVTAKTERVLAIEFKQKLS
jgi:tRNA(Ile)-lysidine synthase